MNPVPLKVLLVEDSPSDAALLRETLSEAEPGQFEYTETATWAEALKTLQAGHFDIILLDLSLPDSHGPETFLRARAAAPTVPIVVMSGLADEAVSLEAVRRGIQDYLVKGQADGRQTARAIRYAIERKRSEEALKAAKAALQQSEARLRLALEAACEGVWEWNLQTGGVLWSPENYELYGLDPAQGPPTYADWEKLLHPEDQARTSQAMRDTVAGLQAEYRAEFRVLHPQQGIRWIFAIGRVERGPNGLPVRMVGINLDITQRKDFEAELERLVAERTTKLQEMVAELQHVSYALVHDMRAPLRAMQGFATILEADCGNCERTNNAEYSKRIRAAAKRMDIQITDALRYTKASLEELPLEPVDLGQLVHELVESYPNLQPDKADIRIEGDLPIVVGNESLLTQCFSNLLGNAVKFVRPGQRPQVRVWAERVESGKLIVDRPPVVGQPSTLNPPLVRIWVEDNGIGIPKNAQAKLFRMFQRMTTGGEGTGIGLAIVCKVAERMGGKAGVESEEGQGSRFWVELHCAAAVAD